MNKFGVLKTKILQKLTEAYASGNKSEIKEILTAVSKNKDFREMYLFYEEIENKYIEDKESAKMYIDEITSLLQEKTKKITKFSKELEKKLGDVVINENELYSNLDILSQNDTLRNLDKKVNGRMKLIEHLMTKKEIVEETNTSFTVNENFLHNVLTNNFNVLYDNTLNEEQKNELKKILEISENELVNNFNTLKEEVTSKMNKMISEEHNIDLKEKLITSISEARQMKPTKYNYYKLQQLKNGI
jgi:hypothetical protein